MAKRGSVEAFKEAEARRQERINSSKASNTSDAIKQKRDAFNAKVKTINEARRILKKLLLNKCLINYNIT